MKKIFSTIKEYLYNHSDRIIVFVTTFISICSFIYYFINDLNLGYGDAVSRLNIARSVIDNLNPGFAQLGGVWLPLPQALMVPFIWNNFLWHSGIAAYFISGTSFILAVYFIFKICSFAFGGKIYGLIAAAILLSSINLLYIQTTAMSEMFFIATIAGSTYYLYLWAKENNLGNLILAGLFVSISTLTRYEGYFIFICSALIVIIVSIIKKKAYKIIESDFVLFLSLAATGIILWLIYSWAIFGDPFYWKNVYFHTKSIISTDTNVHNITYDAVYQKGNVFITFYSYLNAIFLANGIFISGLALIGFVFFSLSLIYKKRFVKQPENIVLLLPLSAIVFIVYAIYSGSVPLSATYLNILNIFHYDLKTFANYNLRYGLISIPIIAIIFSWVAARNIVAKIFCILIVILQLFLTIYSPILTVYPLSNSSTEAASSSH